MESLPSKRRPFAAEKAGDVDGIDLTLSLSVGGGVEKKKNPPPRVDRAGDRMRVKERPTQEDRAVLESQMKQSRAGDRAAKEEEVSSADRARDAPKDGRNSVDARIPNPNPDLFIWKHPLPVVYPCHHLQYVPTPNGFAFGFPFVMPCWASAFPAAAVVGGENLGDKIMPRPVASGSPPVQATAATNPCHGGLDSEKGIGDSETGKTPAKINSTGSGASALSNHRSGSFQGGCVSSVDSRNSAVPEEDAAKKLVSGPHRTSNTKPLERTASVNKPSSPTARKPSLSRRRLPLVSATGDGPDGRTVHGFLYRYNSESEVRIQCICHGRSFTPAEFVGHAGVADVSQPLKQIVVVGGVGSR
ncbi:uncharacterized protein LOC141813450 [Curcuma longa]|uniref:uncharacterized protein LOC141813450 n=1 Tax=Curcuma longa TaxID=136217 RepID=UPI003D9EE708